MSLQTKLADMSSDFRSVLETRTQNLKEQKDRREQFALTPSTTPNKIAAQELRKRNLDSQAEVSAASSSQQQQHYNNQTGGANFDPNQRMDAPQNSGPAAAAQFSQLQLSSGEDAYMQSRADAVESIESTIVELGGIFQQLATMVQEQGEQVQRIDANVMDAEMNVDAAHSELLKYFDSIRSNRWLMLKIFGTLLVFFFIFVAVT
eukprot:Nk52_evm25s224 gene=Nk52_evmTU25s224